MEKYKSVCKKSSDIIKYKPMGKVKMPLNALIRKLIN